MADQSHSEEYLIVSQMIENDAFSQWMGVNIEEVKKGYCKISCEITKEMLNGFKVTHGGIIFSLADSALAFSAATFGRVSLAIDNSISLFKKTEVGDKITAISQCLNLTHKTGVFEIYIYNSADEKIAMMKATVYRTSEEFKQ